MLKLKFSKSTVSSHKQKAQKLQQDRSGTDDVNYGPE